MKNAVMQSRYILIKGMRCPSCVSKIEHFLQQQTGIQDISVNFATSTARVTYDEKVLSFERVIEWLYTLGYSAGEKGIHAHRWHWEDIFLFARMTVSLMGAIPLLVSMFIELLHRSMLSGGWQLLLSTIVQTIGGYSFYIGSYRAIRSRNLNMDVLVAMGTTVAFLYSLTVYVWSLEGHLYFETSATIISLVLLGHVIEMQAKKRASRGIHSLYSLQSDEAQIERNGNRSTIPIHDVRTGDRIVINVGTKISVDGRVVEGSSYIDESMLTGESLPVRKEPGHVVFAGSMNMGGVIIITATAEGATSRLQQIIQLVEEALSSKPKIQCLIDRFLFWFVPAVVSISFLTFILWLIIEKNLSQAIISAISTLIVACPCALGLATPTVIMVAIGRSTSMGVLVKDFNALTEAGKIRELIIDKTGTVTEGYLSLSTVQVIDETQKERTLRQAVSLAQNSSHPLSKSIVRAVGITDPCSFSQIREEAGQGLQGYLEGVLYFLGSKKWLEQNGIEIHIGIHEQQTTLFFGGEGKLLATFYLQDHIRNSSYEGMMELKKLGIKTFLLSGDREAIVKNVAERLHMNGYRAEVSPEEKGEYVAQRAKRQKHLAVIGDGINDAIALAKAPISMSVFSAADIVHQITSIGLLKDNLLNVVNFISLSKKTKAKLWQNIFFAFIYNAIGIPVAAFGLLNPMIAGVAMALSSISVVTNALLLQKKR